MKLKLEDVRRHHGKLRIVQEKTGKVLLGQLRQLAVDLQHVGCHSVAVDAVDFTVDVAVMPIEQLLNELGRHSAGNGC